MWVVSQSCLPVPLRAGTLAFCTLYEPVIQNCLPTVWGCIIGKRTIVQEKVWLGAVSSQHSQQLGCGGTSPGKASPPGTDSTCHLRQNKPRQYYRLD